jgi:glycosyltransferase involved in cell wall biosynthesis
LPAVLEGETLLVFADDWGAHPSSAQHLMRRFLARNHVIWVNTIGLRLPRLSLRDLWKIVGKLRHWSGSARPRSGPTPELHDLPLVPLPFGPLARTLNARLLRNTIPGWLARAARPPFIVSTLPLTADLAGGVRAATFVYYLVDDYAAWPGLGGDLVRAMDVDQARASDVIVAASQALADMHRAQARAPIAYLPHGVDVAHFSQARTQRRKREAAGVPPRADVVFFGVMDERIDRKLLGAVIRARPSIRFLLVGPGLSRADPDTNASNVLRSDAVDYDVLPHLLGDCQVALLPYVRSPFVERAAPLKAREALAAGLPVVGTDVPDLRALRRGVRLGNTLDEVLAALDQALASPEDLPTLEDMAVDSWEDRAERLSELLLAARAGRRMA